MKPKGPQTDSPGDGLLDWLRAGKSLMFVGAHPDDETVVGPLLARAAELSRAIVVCFTKGEGGRNLTGPQLDGALAEIRARELAAACEALGVEHRILGFWNGLPGGLRNPENARETPQQALARWGKSGRDPQAELVRAVREWKPDLLITFDPEQGFTRHKEHRAVSLLASAAFGEAGEPSKHPEQIRRGLSVWRPQRLYYVVNRFARLRDPQIENVEESRITELIDGAERSPRRGRRYFEIALEAMEKHETQFGAEARNNREVMERVSREVQQTALILARAAEDGPGFDPLHSECPRGA